MVFGPHDTESDHLMALVTAGAAKSGQITLVTLGPLTNIALALKKHPDLVRAPRFPTTL